ncbi:MAG TPA: hypothetical protein ENF23_04565 [Methanosarcinales archaeon]|nr:hypothetical protein [Methanosarcinales archaeon]
MKKTERLINKWLRDIIPEVNHREVRGMYKLNKCPKCGSQLYHCGRIQICIRCGYWTRAGTANLDSLIIS